MDKINAYLDVYLLHKKTEEGTGHCPSHGQLGDYTHGKLDKKMQEKFQDHIALCDACQDQVLALKKMERPFSWEEFKNHLYANAAYEPKKIILYINGEKFAESDVGEKGFGDISLKITKKIDFIEIKNDKGHIMDYIDPALYSGKKLKGKVNLTADRLVFTAIEFKKERTYIRARYQHKSKHPSFVKNFTVTAIASLAVALVFISYAALYYERTATKKVNNLLQNTLRTYEKKMAELGQQNEQLHEGEKKYQAMIAELKQQLRRPHTAVSIYESIPLVLKAGGEQQVKPLRIEFTEKIKSITLAFSFFAQDYKTYEVAIYDKDKTKLLWTSGTQPIATEKGEPHAMISLTLYEGFPPQGNYSLRIYGKSGKKKLMAEYPLLVRHGS